MTSLLLIRVALCLPPAPASGPAGSSDKTADAPRPRLAVLDFRVSGKVEETGGELIAAHVRTAIHQADLFDLMDRQMMKERMTEKDFASTTECDQVRCLVRYGKSLDVQKMVGGLVSSFGQTWDLSMLLVDVNTGKVEATFSRNYTGAMEDLLELGPQGARVLLGLDPGPALVPSPPSPGPSGAPSQELTLDLGGGVTMELVLVPAGEFLMGSPESEVGRDDDEGPQHRVTIARPFYLGEYEVTQAQWQAVMGSNPSFFKGDDELPVENMFWEDCQRFCEKLNERIAGTGRGVRVRLPTEAEWEYACRARSTGRFCFGDSDGQLGEHAWYHGNSGDQTHSVGRKEPNAWGLYDVHGNVWEWCEDVWHGPYAGAPDDGSAWTAGGDQDRRVLRGGCWSRNPSLCRSAVRGPSKPGYRDGNAGFRCASGT